MAVIKEGDAPAQVRSIDRAMRKGPRNPAAAGPTALDLAEMEIGRLRAEIERLEAQVVDAETALPAARDESFRAGFAEGKSAGEHDHASGVVRLEAGLGRAVSTYVEAMENLERLAPAVALSALQKVLGAAPAQAELVEIVVREQLTRLERSAVLRIEVSRRDFADEPALAILATAVVAPLAKIESREDLAAGECRIRLTLGSLEIGPAQQWRLLDGLLSDLADEGTV